VSVPGAVKYLTIAQIKLLKDGLLKEAQEAEFVVSDLFFNDDTGGPKVKFKKQQGPDDAMAKIKFDEYLRDVYLEVKKGGRE